MVSPAALRLQHMRKQHIYTRAHNRKLSEAGVDKNIRDFLAISGMAGADPGVVAESTEAQQRQAIQAFISKLADIVPNARFSCVEFDFVTIGIPNAFAARVGDSYAIGLENSVRLLLNILFVAALIAYEKKNFRIFGACAAELVGCLYNIKEFFEKRTDEDFAEGMLLLHGYYHQSSDDIRAIIDGVSESATSFIIGHELAHIQLQHFKTRTASTLRLTPGDGPTDVSAFVDHACEYEADLWAAEWLLKAAGNNIKEQTFAAVVPFLCFTILMFTSRLHEPAPKIGRLLRSTHPSDAERASRLAKFSSQQLHLPPTDALQLLVNVTCFLQDEMRALKQPD